MWHDDLAEARKQGERWAVAKADVLDGNIPAMDWPDVWQKDWDGDLDLGDVDERQRQALREEAHHAAVERWAAIVHEHRELEDVEDEERDEEAGAVRLMRALTRDLPRGLLVGHDGPRLFVQDTRTGEELTITSLRQAWKAIDYWKEPSH